MWFSMLRNIVSESDRNIVTPEAADFARRSVEQGKLGRKTGEGFYKYTAPDKSLKDRIIYLDIIQGQIRSCAKDGSDDKTIVDGLQGAPDGIQIDMRPGKEFLYWTTMGIKANDGAIWRSKHDGRDCTSLLRPGDTRTPKQIVLDSQNDRLYWCDREGGRIQCCQLNGTELETLYDSARGAPRPLSDGKDWCVGIAIDNKRNLMYWTQKGSSKGSVGRILRAPIHVEDNTERQVEVLFNGLPEPIDLELDISAQMLYCVPVESLILGLLLTSFRLTETDRSDPPYGNTFNKASVSSAFNSVTHTAGPSLDLIIAEHFHEAIGVAVDHRHGTAYVTDLLGTLWSVSLKEGKKTALKRDTGNMTGVAIGKVE